MNYNDEQILDVETYDKIAKAYLENNKQSGFNFIKIDNKKNSILIEEIFEKLSQIKSCLFRMGGFLNTTQFYLLNERQIKKLKILFDYDCPIPILFTKHDKTQCFLNFIGLETGLIKLLLEVCHDYDFENIIELIVHDRLSLLNNIFEQI